MKKKNLVVALALTASASWAAFSLSSLPIPLPSQLTNPLDSALGSLQNVFAQSPFGAFANGAPTPNNPSLPGADAFANLGDNNPLAGPSLLDPTQAAAALTALTMGRDLPAPLSLELSKFLGNFGNLSPSGEQTPEMAAMAQDLISFLVGSLTSAGAAPSLPNGLPNGIPGLDALPGLDSLPGASNLPIPLASGSQPSLNDLFNAYGLGTTVAYLVATYAVPDLGPWILPHNVRSLTNYVKTTNNTATEGTVIVPFVTSGVSKGQSFTITNTTNVDAVIATALDQHTVNDTIVIQAPLSIEVKLTGVCNAVLFGRCRDLKITTTTENVQDKVLATNASYTFAYPLNAGQFPTRATAMDIFQVAYDALGTLNDQKPREATAASPLASIPGLSGLTSKLPLPLPLDVGLADLSTQAPKVNSYGVQVTRGGAVDSATSQLLAPVLNVLPIGPLNIRRVEPVIGNNSNPLPLPLPFQTNGSLNGQDFTNLLQLDSRLGMTAGYAVNTVKTGKINIMAVRWHNLGTETLGRAIDNVGSQLQTAQLSSLTSQIPGLDRVPGLDQLPSAPSLPAGIPSAATALKSAPATFYYDVPVGEYLLGAERVNGNSLIALDYPIAGTPPSLSLPPKLPSAADLQTLASNIQALLSGNGAGLPTGLPDLGLPSGVPALP